MFSKAGGCTAQGEEEKRGQEVEEEEKKHKEDENEEKAEETE